MIATETLTQLPIDEERVLNTIVDAMLAAESELQTAADAQWSRILVDSCRRLKGHAGELPLTTSC